MAKLSKDKTIVSISLSKEVVEILNVFNNRSKLIDDMLSSLLLNLSPAEMLELLKTMTNGGDIVEFLIKKKCKELGIGSETKQVKESVIEEKKSKSKINLQDWW